VSWYQKGKNYLDFTEARDSEWQWHQLGHTQVCTSLQTGNHTNTPPLSFFIRPDALPQSINICLLWHDKMQSCHPTNSVKAPKAK